MSSVQTGHTLRYISALPGGAWCGKRPRSLALLGSTGSIGRSALDVIRLQKDAFLVAALAGAANIDLLARQAAEFRPDHLSVLSEADIPRLRALLPAGYSPAILAGQEGYETLARLPGVDTVLSAQVGAAGLRATCAAARAGKVIALANKESLVLAGSLIRAVCAASGARILPVDSEHNAIFQCLCGSFTPGAAATASAATSATISGAQPAKARRVTRLILTASGGPFWGKSKEELRRVTVDEALRHPNWTMGAKVTIDSSTLMNKGLELIEAHHLFGLPMEALDVVVHPESIVHSLVAFADGSQLAQLGSPDMHIPIAHCLGWPERLETGAAHLDLAAVGSLRFARPDHDLFPCLRLAREAQERGCGSPVVLNAANEIAVAAFLERRIGYGDIPGIVDSCLAAHAGGAYSTHKARTEPGFSGGDAGPGDVDEILALDAETRTRARDLLR